METYSVSFSDACYAHDFFYALIEELKSLYPMQPYYTEQNLMNFLYVYGPDGLYTSPHVMTDFDKYGWTTSDLEHYAEFKAELLDWLIYAMGYRQGETFQLPEPKLINELNTPEYTIKEHPNMYCMHPETFATIFDPKNNSITTYSPETMFNSYPSKIDIEGHLCSTNITIDPTIWEILTGQTKKPEPVKKRGLIHAHDIPEVVKVDSYNDRVTMVRFADGSFTKAVCSPNDHYDLDVGISICLLKRMLGNHAEDASRLYNNLLRSIHKTMDNCEKQKKAEAEEKKKAREKQKKAEMKNKALRMKEKEERIDIVRQGLIRAQHELRKDDET